MSNQIDTLVKMLNQISANNIAYEPDEAATRVSNHIKHFWALSMKKKLLEVAPKIGDDLGYVELMAIKKLKESYQKL
jgi:hypothetical protein